jgi:choloylglycine hydrolase
MVLKQIFISFLSCCAAAEACTAFQLTAQEGGFIYCRSMEFGFPMGSDVLIVPRKTAFTGTAPRGATGLAWSSVYGYVGMNQTMAPTLVSDGMNEKGLVVGCLYLPGYAQYEEGNASSVSKTIGPWELVSYLLGTCETIEEVKVAVSKVLVAQQPGPNMGPGIGEFVLPLHFYVGDAKGDVIIIEYVKGVRHIYANPLGVLTNSPPFDWQLIHLSNFINLSPVNASGLKLGDLDVRAPGQGSGLLGLPGDYTPPSRFARATLFSQWAKPQKTLDEAVRMGFHILNTFDIFEGIVRDVGKEERDETTEWVVVHDRSRLKTYFRHYNSLKIEMIDLKKIDFSKSGLRQIPMETTFAPQDVTGN